MVLTPMDQSFVDTSVAEGAADHPTRAAPGECATVGSDSRGGGRRAGHTRSLCATAWLYTKGHRTPTDARDLRENETGNPGMATAARATYDRRVAALVAQGLEPFVAAQLCPRPQSAGDLPPRRSGGRIIDLIQNRTPFARCREIF